MKSLWSRSPLGHLCIPFGRLLSLLPLESWPKHADCVVVRIQMHRVLLLHRLTPPFVVVAGNLMRCQSSGDYENTDLLNSPGLTHRLLAALSRVFGISRWHGLASEGRGIWAGVVDPRQAVHGVFELTRYAINAEVVRLKDRAANPTVGASLCGSRTLDCNNRLSLRQAIDRCRVQAAADDRRDQQQGNDGKVATHHVSPDVA